MRSGVARDIRNLVEPMVPEDHPSKMPFDPEQLTDADLNRQLPFPTSTPPGVYLQSLPSPSFVVYNSEHEELKRGPCTPGTRTQPINGMLSWAGSAGPGAVLWVTGMAGTGKTTIAFSLCEQLENQHKLAASFFCSRLLPECRNVNGIIPSLVRQLTQNCPGFETSLLQVLDPNSKSEWMTCSLEVQFHELIVKPLQTPGAETPSPSKIVVIDALDECENKDSAEGIFDVLATQASSSPLMFIVFARPIHNIQDRLSDLGGDVNKRVTIYRLDEDRDPVKADIKMHLRSQMDLMSSKITPWPEPEQPDSSKQCAADRRIWLEKRFEELAGRAGALFIYAATAIRYISHGTSARQRGIRLRNVLGAPSRATNEQYAEIDSLYTTILQEALRGCAGPDARDDMLLVLHTVICALEPLTIDTISELLQKDEGQVRSALNPLQSVLQINRTSHVVTTLHASFPEYLFARDRSKQYHCNSVNHNKILSQACFNRLKHSRKQFNICDLESSYDLDTQIVDLPRRVEASISAGLFYSCQNWAAHLSSTGKSTDNHLPDLFYDFLSVRLLLWIEIMNLKKHAHAAVKILKQAENWCTSQGLPNLIRLAHDAWRFTATFALNPVCQSTPHLYISMLLFWPQSRPVSIHYAARSQHRIKIEGKAVNLERRQLALLATWPFEEEVHSASFSPDGTRIALAVGKRVLVVNADSGRREPGFSLAEHKERVTAVRFSPDSSGSKVISGSEDGTICVWDGRTGKLALGPLCDPGIAPELHQITSVSVTQSPTDPEYMYIASGSYDGCVRIWDTKTGKLAFNPLMHPTDNKRHESWVLSVSFSPDGRRVVSGSENRSMCVWDIQPGGASQAFELPNDNTSDFRGPVKSVGFSPEGNRIVSGSGDEMVCIWHVTKRAKLNHIHAHQSEVNSVGFSPDGSRIVSGSADRGIRVWSSANGDPLLGPLKGHRGQITSVEFSPDDTRIVSCSDDRTVRVWDAEDSREYFQPEGPPRAWVTARADENEANRVNVLTPTSRRAITGWQMHWNGWLKSESQLMIWVPDDLHSDSDPTKPPIKLRKPTLVCSTGSVNLTFHEACIGKNWSQCFVEEIQPK
ncbi:unnamed protein product [Rhizoctonia solani]|uniref:Nephrocystin 3-like N-terminal domain-containing protein n=1 Tax=Rhizoctonia solani TaxID=456999 RepID=A0A8H3HCM7_9AGAM|nr:unnamed protein product [Rhizoctonia solani]